ncbi:serine/threonine protein kinase [Aquabacterium sp. J223]|uniref:serine/threonine protein kinase n=1 Tax=Aquabacterium sp. J223 TaxID=2898431 RepID=UPI0021AE2916|nr:serine/threonine protein kinase [Aquabacterium sp. J223]UUX96502.1 serine/threonine protein kinase [Aquabacterium sp. J223]
MDAHPPTTSTRPASSPRDSYAGLTPPKVLDALEQVGLYGDGRLLQLNSYENRVFLLHLEDGSAVVAKFYRPGRWSRQQILEEHALVRELADDEVPAVPPLALPDGGTLGSVRLGDGVDMLFSISARHAGRAPELEDDQTLRWLGRFIARLHVVGGRRPFEHRLTLSPATWGRRAQALLLDSPWLDEPQRRPWAAACEAALQAVEGAFAAAADVPRLRLHGDCHPGNVLWREAEGPHFVDFDDACTGPAVHDLWMLASPGDPVQWAALLDGYTQIRPLSQRELTLVEPLRTLRMVHHAGWLAARWDDPAFPAAFPWFGTPAYWSQQTQQLQEQLEAMSAPPVAP